MSKKKNLPPPRKSNQTLTYAGLAVLFIAAIFLYFSIISGTGPETSAGKDPSAGLFIKLNKPGTYEPGKVKIVEFMKFNCGHCYSLNQQMPALKKKYGDKLEITYRPMLWRSLPQDQGFRKSIEAYIIAERMGKGEQMKDALFNAVFGEHLFSWDKIPGSDSGRLMDFLARDYGADWVKTAKIEKTDDGKTIKVSLENKSLSLSLNNEKTKVNLKIDDDRADELMVRMENGKPEIYLIEQRDLTSQIVLSDIAKSAGLGEDFTAALKNGDAKSEAEANIALAESFQVEETPTMIINGNIKITPSLTNGDVAGMTANLDTVIGSLLS